MTDAYGASDAGLGPQVPSPQQEAPDEGSMRRTDTSIAEMVTGDQGVARRRERPGPAYAMVHLAVPIAGVAAAVLLRTDAFQEMNGYVSFVSWAVITPFGYVPLFLIWLIGAFTAQDAWRSIQRVSSYRLTEHASSPAQILAVKRLNLRLIAVNSALGIVAVLFSTGSIELVGLTVSSWATYTATLLMPVVFGTYLLGVRMFYVDRNSLAVSEGSRAVLAWSRYAAPLAGIAWYVVVLLYFGTVSF